MNFRPTMARISLENLAHNVRVLRGLQKYPEQFFCPMVKADAYGHGDLPVTKRLLAEGITHVGVATAEEGLRLRENLGLGFGVLVFAPLIETAVSKYVEAELTPVLSSWTELDLLEKHLYHKARFRVHLKFNTGMSRLGFAVDDAEKLARHLRDNDRFTVEGVCTHLACGEDAASDKAYSARQLRLFFTAARAFRAPGVHFHALNSAGLIASWCGNNESHLEFGARCGISLYGVKQELTHADAAAHERWLSLDLKPVMRLESRVALVQKLRAGDKVSYGGHWTSSGDSAVAVIPMGYADGLSRLLSNKGRMLIRGHWVPIVGTVCMDYTMVDVTALVEEGQDLSNESVVVLGSQGDLQQTAGDLAALIGTNAYEILTSVSRRVPRVYE